MTPELRDAIMKYKDPENPNHPNSHSYDGSGVVCYMNEAALRSLYTGQSFDEDLREALKGPDIMRPSYGGAWVILQKDNRVGMNLPRTDVDAKTVLAELRVRGEHGGMTRDEVASLLEGDKTRANLAMRKIVENQDGIIAPNGAFIQYVKH